MAISDQDFLAQDTGPQTNTDPPPAQDSNTLTSNAQDSGMVGTDKPETAAPRAQLVDPANYALDSAQRRYRKLKHGKRPKIRNCKASTKRCRQRSLETNKRYRKQKKTDHSRSRCKLFNLPQPSNKISATSLAMLRRWWQSGPLFSVNVVGVGVRQLLKPGWVPS